MAGLLVLAGLLGYLAACAVTPDLHDPIDAIIQEPQRENALADPGGRAPA